MHLKVIRIVTAGWLFGWFCKIAFYWPYLTKVVYDHPISHDLFPSFFLNSNTSLIFYFSPSICIFSLFADHKHLHRLSALIMIVSAAMMNLHINTYNDATFVTSFWVALWLLWFSFNVKKGAIELQGCILAQLTIGVIFLGGFVGKLTPEYYNGNIIYQIFMEQTQESPINVLLGSLTTQKQMMAAAVISKIILCGEFLIAINILFTSSFGFILVLIIMPMLMLFSTWKILSVISALISLAVAGMILDKHANPSIQTHG